MSKLTFFALLAGLLWAVKSQATKGSEALSETIEQGTAAANELGQLIFGTESENAIANYDPVQPIPKIKRSQAAILSKYNLSRTQTDAMKVYLNAERPNKTVMLGILENANRRSVNPYSIRQMEEDLSDLLTI